MRVPTRKGDKIPRENIDTKITLEKYQKLQRLLKKLKENVGPVEAEEVKMLSTGGDYSENAGYQSAKARLKRTNNKITKIEFLLTRAEIIQVNKDSKEVNIGNTVKLEAENDTRKYQILGSAETNPEKGLISYNSPLGSILIGKKIGDLIKFKNGKEYIIKEIC